MTKRAAQTPIPYFILAAVLASAVFGAWIPLETMPITDALESIYSDSQGAAMGHALIGLILFSGLLWMTLKKRVVPIPHLKILLPLAIVELAVTISFGVSQYRHLSLMTLLEWLAYGATFILTVASVGRGSGVRWVLVAFTVAGVWLALLGIREYGTQADPTWRIFAHTMGPNALAAFLCVCLFPACILAATEDRVGKLMAGIAGSMMVVSLMLTGSKGGLLSAVIGGIVMLLVSGKLMRKSIIGLGACAVLGFGLAYGITHRPTKAGPIGSPLGRVAGAASTSEQSSGFRKNLWAGSIKLMTMNPLGYGIGTYRFQSARTGTTTQTQLAHNSFLQLGVEAGALGLTGFLVFLALLARASLTGSRTQPDATRLQKAAVVASIAAFLAHSVFDSDLQVFGLGVMFFVLCGMALQLAIDGSTPEFLQPAFRKSLIVSSCLAPLAMLYFGWVDIRHGMLRGGLSATTREQLSTDIQSLQALAPLDSRVFFTSYQLSASAQIYRAEQRSFLTRAISLGPSLAMYRALARLDKAEQSGNPDQFLDKVYELDPYNYPALLLDIEQNRKDNPDRARRAALKLVASETTPYFLIRSIPELIPLETYQGRAFLAESLEGEAKAEMLKPAVVGFVRFAKITAPEIKRFADGGVDGGFGAMTKVEGIANLDAGLALVATYRLVGDVALAESARESLVRARDSLR